jgi:hypothetical protein
MPANYLRIPAQRQAKPAVRDKFERFHGKLAPQDFVHLNLLAYSALDCVVGGFAERDHWETLATHFSVCNVICKTTPQAFGETKAMSVALALEVMPTIRCKATGKILSVPVATPALRMAVHACYEVLQMAKKSEIDAAIDAYMKYKHKL